MKKYYVTTPIFYASAKPQLGNAYSALLADTIARYKKLKGYDVVFQTGMDEHGKKVQIKAEEQNQNPQDFVDSISLEVKRVLESININYDTFARTTNPQHKKIVQKIFKKLYDQGDIYLGKYSGWYCTPCESFFTETQLVDGKCPDCGRDVEKTEEEAYFLNLKKYSPWLKNYIETHEDFITPKERRNEMLKFIEQGLDDLCVSRTSFNWGIKVPFDEKHVIYVWLDALTNYITFQGYLTDEKFNTIWPADLHIVGKDILRFHTIYWPIMLKALNLPMPKQVLGHPFLVDAKGGKMSKSKGNVLYADVLAQKYGIDAIRYYLLSELGIHHDGGVSEELIVEKYNSDLANTLGNLVNRTINMSKKYFDKKVEKPKEFENMDKEIIEMSKTLGDRIDKKMNELKVSESLNEIFTLLKRANKYIDETEPWILAKNEEKKERLNTVLYNLLEMIRISATYLQAFLPDTADKIFKQLNTQNRRIDSTKDFEGMDPGIVLNDPEIIFQRIDKEDFIKE